MVLEWREAEVVEFPTPYSVSVSAVERCEMH